MIRNAVSSRAFLVILLLVLLASAFVLPQPTCSDASGCSLEGANAGSCGGDPCCWGSGTGCYVCYYTVHGGTTKCSESDGDSFCIDYQW